ncbi:MAG: hypothetical protein AB8H47_04450 [Bacteroidia bacterium]
MKKQWLSAILNFFFMGLGYIYNGERKLLGILLTIGAIMLTYVEQFYKFPDGFSLQQHDFKAFIIMAIAVLIINTGLAFDAYKEADKINSINAG